MSKIKKDVFGISGLLHRDFGDGYEFRESQVNMSIASAKAILNRDVLLAEGATGVGKSFAYLIAAVSPFLRQALAEKELDAPIVISTSTKVLQDQLWKKDVPAILTATDQILRVVLAKGRNNYASARRLDVEDNTFEFATAEDAAIGTRIALKLKQWIETSDGEFANFGEELPLAGNFSRIRQQLGLDASREVVVEDESESPQKQVVEKVYPSPFPFRKNVEIHLFGNTILDRAYDLEEKDAYMQQQVRLVEYYIRLRGGRALVLCTSQHFLVELSEMLAPLFQEIGIQALCQFGTDKLKQTLKTFKEDERSVLLGVASCWEGLDAPGPTLETVIIPQLPFAPPHPLLDARRALLENPERDWFHEISLPDMLLHLKQGAGRLVRSTTDKGVIALLSPRPSTKYYGRYILKALPPGRKVINPPDALKFLVEGEGA